MVFKLFVDTILSGEAIRQIQQTTELSPGIRSAGSTFVGLGILGSAANTAKDSFNVFKKK